MTYTFERTPPHLRDRFVTAYEEYWDTAYMLRQLGPGAAFPPSPAFTPTD